MSWNTGRRLDVIHWTYTSGYGLFGIAFRQLFCSKWKIRCDLSSRSRPFDRVEASFPQKFQHGIKCKNNKHANKCIMANPVHSDRRPLQSDLLISTEESILTPKFDPETFRNSGSLMVFGAIFYEEAWLSIRNGRTGSLACPAPCFGVKGIICQNIKFTFSYINIYVFVANHFSSWNSRENITRM